MPDLQLLQAASIATLPCNENELRWSVCQSVLRSFRENVIRTARMIEAPVYAAMTADVHRMAVHRVFEKEPTKEEFLARSNSIGKEMKATMAVLINGECETQVGVLEGYTHNLNSFIQQTENIHPVFESLLNAMLIQAWTTYEVLVKQLLPKCIKGNPECFSLPADKEPFSFLSIEKIRKSYKIGFQSSGRIQNILHDECVDSLCMIRNLLVHDSGIVNQAFLDKCAKKHCPGWAKLPLGQTYQPTGFAVKSLADAMVKNGCRLIKTVDKWLTEHRPKGKGPDESGTLPSEP